MAPCPFTSALLAPRWRSTDPRKEIVSESRKADRERAKREAAARRKASAPWFAFLTIYTTARDFQGRLDVFNAIRSLGGYQAARAKFEEHKNEPGIKGAE